MPALAAPGGGVVLVTGCAGFIGHGVARALLARGETVLGLDNLNAYYEPALKQARLQTLAGERFTFVRQDLADAQALAELFGTRRPERVVHLAAQAGVRYSFENPRAYVESNIAGFVNLLECARAADGVSHVVYASSSSVYGGNAKQPFAVQDPVERPLSLYAASKRADELIAQVYALQFGLPLTGLRYFTVYGPWGRPDMAPLKFARAIFEGRPIEVYGDGDMRRDFTYIDDIVQGTLLALDDRAHFDDSCHRLYNLGNDQPEPLLRFIELLEDAIGRRAQRHLLPMQPGDVRATWADIGPSRRELGWQPTTRIEDGLPRLVEWVRAYYRY